MFNPLRALAPGRWLLLLLAFAGSAQAQTPAFEESRLTIETERGAHELAVELALTPAQRQRGLMFRDHLADDRGMLFDFVDPQPITMWMRNTLIPLDMLFIDGDGRITRIAARTTPLSDAVIRSDGPVRAVLELRGGRAAELGIRQGDRVLHPLLAPATAQ